MTIKVFPDKRTLAKYANNYFLNIAQKSIEEHGAFFAALSGGSTPKDVYRMLGQRKPDNDISWEHIHIFWSDERSVPPDHPESNYGMAYNAWLKSSPIPVKNIHRVPTQKEPEEAALAYQHQILSTLGTHPRFDLILLGLGTNGHTASIFPGHIKVINSKKLVMADYIEKLSSWRITFTPHLINNAREIIFLVAGSHKADILHRVLSTPPLPETLPAQAIHPLDGKLDWFIDKDASSSLDSSIIHTSSS